MTTRTISTGARFAALALAAGAITLAGCEEHAYPSAAPREATAAPPAADVPLAGAPTDGYPPTTRTPEYIPPGAGAYPPPYPSQGGYPPPPESGPYGPPTGYPPGYAHSNPQGAPPVIVSMAPIPNPPERPAYVRRHHHHHYWMHGYGTPSGHRWHYVYGAAPYAGAPMHHHHRVRHVYAAPVAPAHHAAAVRPQPKPAPVHPVAPAPGAQLAKPKPLDHHHHHHGMDAATAAAAAGGPTAANTTSNTMSNATGNTVATGSEADRYQALEQSLQGAFATAAKMTDPGHLDAGQTGVVTLTLPAGFGQTVQEDAAKQDLAQSMTSVNLIATLAADGYTIVPGEPQTLPLTVGQATTFQWKVTPTGMDRSAFKASVHAQAVDDNHALNLGDKSSGGAHLGRWIGLGLLAVVALALLGWAARRRRPIAGGAVKPRANHQNGD